MGNREFASIILGCCGTELDVTFDEAEAPFLAPWRLRKNVACPDCTSVVILTLTRRPEGEHQIEQELIQFN